MIAETGAGDAFMDEVAACGGSCGAPHEFGCSPMSGVCSGEGLVTATPGHPYLSLASMLAPSPDWCAPLDTKCNSRTAVHHAVFVHALASRFPCIGYMRAASFVQQCVVPMNGIINIIHVELPTDIMVLPHQSLLGAVLVIITIQES